MQKYRILSLTGLLSLFDKSWKIMPTRFIALLSAILSFFVLSTAACNRPDYTESAQETNSEQVDVENLRKTKLDALPSLANSSLISRMDGHLDLSDKQMALIDSMLTAAAYSTTPRSQQRLIRLDVWAKASDFVLTSEQANQWAAILAEKRLQREADRVNQ